MIAQPFDKEDSNLKPDIKRHWIRFWGILSRFLMRIRLKELRIANQKPRFF